MNIEQLFATGDMDLAMEQSQMATFPFLRELADFIVGGGRFPSKKYMDTYTHVVLLGLHQF